MFLAIARHETFRGEVVEIIYDDARLPRTMETEEDAEGEAYGHERPPEGVPYWYNRTYEEMLADLSQLQERGSIWPSYAARQEKLKARMSVEESYAVFLRLRRQQEEVIRTNRDTEALKVGLQGLPNLRTITITPATHGRELRPLFETPMIRDLPQGFIYPLPRGWPEPETFPMFRSWSPGREVRGTNGAVSASLPPSWLTDPQR